MNKKQNTRGFSTHIRKIYVKENNTLNRFALFLSALAIALIILLLVNFKSFMLSSNHADASELSASEAIQEIYDYINSLDSFTDEQRAILNSTISDYINGCDYLTEDDLSIIYKLIDAKYQANFTEISNLKLEIENKYNSLSINDVAHYDELLKLIDNLSSTVEENRLTAKRDKEDLSQDISRTQDDIKKNKEALSKAITEARDEAAESDKKIWEAILKVQNSSENGEINIYKTINNIQETYNENNDAIWKAVRTLNERTTDQDGLYELNFGYQDGCYGYYVDGNFKRF